MTDIRFQSKPTKANPVGADFFIGTDSVTGDDAKFEFSSISNFVLSDIGNAVAGVSDGFMSKEDKAKLDLYATATPGNNKVLTTNASGDIVWVDQSGLGSGDMLKSAYDTLGNNNKVDASVEADGLSSGAGNSKVYVTSASGIPQWIDQTALISTVTGLKTGMEMAYGAPDAPEGWVFQNTKTIGNTGSNATGRESADTFNLFQFLWNYSTNNECQMFDSGGAPVARGATPLDDWTALRAIATPDGRGVTKVGLDTMGGAASVGRLNTFGDHDTAYTIFGNQTHVLTEPQLPAYNQNFTHDHDFTAVLTSTPMAAEDGVNDVESGVPATGTTSQANVNISFGGDQPHNNTQPSSPTGWIIKL